MAKMRAGGEDLAFGIAYRPELYYPHWQFDGNGRTPQVLSRLTAVAEELGYSPRSFNHWMTSEPPDGDVPPLERLRDEGGGEEVLWLLRTFDKK